jgi:small-conductance mechanosensitive channel
VPVYAVLFMLLTWSGASPGQDLIREAGEAATGQQAGDADGEAEGQVPGDITPGQAPGNDGEIPDERVRQNLLNLLNRIEDLRQVEVTVEGGVVQIDGQAATNRAITQARELAERTAGVNFVINNISETQEVSGRLTPALERMSERLLWLLRELPIILMALLVLGIFIWLAKFITRFDAPFALISRKKLVQGIVKQIFATILGLIGILAALEILDATEFVGAVVGAAGLIGLALGFAFRDIAENYLASVFMGLRQPFSTNDIVKIDEHEGRVIRLTTRDTILLSYEGNHIRLPNSLVYKSVMINYTRNPQRRLDFVVGVGVEENLSRAQELGVAALLDTPGIVTDPPPVALVQEFGEFSMNLHFLAWIDQAETDWLATRSEALRSVKRAFDENDVEMPFPTYEATISREAAQRRKEEEKEAPPRKPREPLDENIRETVEAESRDPREENLLENQ